MNKIPVINCISNIVTANDCANVLLAAGFSPIMADEPAEMAEIALAADACVINLGTPSDRKYEAAAKAGAAYNSLRKPVIIDPVGIAVSSYRRENAAKLLKHISPDVIRCNLSEALALLDITENTQLNAGACAEQRDNLISEYQAHKHRYCDDVSYHDKTGSDKYAEQNGSEPGCGFVRDTTGVQPCGIDSRESTDTAVRTAPETAAKLAVRLSCVVLISGAVDTVSDGSRTKLISGGSDKLKEITGSGCMLSALLGGYCAEACLNSDNADMFEAVCSCAADYKQAAELAVSRLSEYGGTGELRMRLVDAAGAVMNGKHR